VTASATIDAVQTRPEPSGRLQAAVRSGRLQAAVQSATEGGVAPVGASGADGAQDTTTKREALSSDARLWD
jgi:hypothetical protein